MNSEYEAAMEVANAVNNLDPHGSGLRAIMNLPTTRECFACAAMHALISDGHYNEDPNFVCTAVDLADQLMAALAVDKVNAGR